MIANTFPDVHAHGFATGRCEAVQEHATHAASRAHHDRAPEVGHDGYVCTLRVLAGRRGRTVKILRHRAGTRGALDVMDAQAGRGAERHRRHPDAGAGFGPDLDGIAAPPELADRWSQLVNLDGDMSRAAAPFGRSDAFRNQKGDIAAFQDRRTLVLSLVAPLLHPVERQTFADHLAGRIEVVNLDAAVIEAHALEEQFAVIDPAHDILDLAGVRDDRRPEPLDELRIETCLAGSLQAGREDLFHARWLHDGDSRQALVLGHIADRPEAAAQQFHQVRIDAVEFRSHGLKPFDGVGFGHWAARIQWNGLDLDRVEPHQGVCAATHPSASSRRIHLPGPRAR